MSDESQPPPLRLRPRVRNEEAAVATPSPVEPPAPPPAVSPAPVPVAPPQSSTAASESGPRLRLKPKLMAEAEPEAALPVEPVEFTPSPTLIPPPAPAPVPVVLPMRAPAVPPPAPVVVSPPEPVTETDGIPRLKLRPLPANIAEGEAVLQTAPIAPSRRDEEPAFMAPAAAASPVFGEIGMLPLPAAPAMKPLSVIKTDAPVPPHVSAPGVLGEVLVSPSRAPFKPPARASRFSLSRMVIAVGVLLVLVGSGYYAHIMFFAAPPAPEPVLIVKKTPPPATMVAPPATVVTAITSQAAVVPENPVVQPAPSATSPQAPVIKVAVKPVPPPPHPPSTEFLTWVDAVKISGVFNGASPRAIINGLLVRPGDTIDAARGIVFDHLDTVRQEFFFRDRSGAITSKSY